MTEKIPKEKLQDLHERSANSLMEPTQCAIWLPLVCEYALTLLREQEGRERLMAMARRIDEFKKATQK
tara:strand:- start:4935 stop:5138 length:204 start_codon:yes stop_codon:yes gene_type:complete